jgi:hypothetical protein
LHIPLPRRNSGLFYYTPTCPLLVGKDHSDPFFPVYFWHSTIIDPAKFGFIRQDDMHKCRILPTMKIWRTKYLRTTDITGALIMKAKLLNRSLVLCILLCFVLAIGAGGCKKKPVQYTLTVAIAG